MELEVLKIWPDWKATRLIGEGSFGKVYEIVRSNFGIEEHCALKVISIPSSEAELQSLKNEGMDDESATEYYKGLVEEFVQEIALMSKLKGNVNIVGYEDYAVLEHKDTIGWDILIRMELLTPLPTYIKERSFTASDVTKLAINVCNALSVCHDQKIIHRDIKPDNIFVSQNEEYKLGDFGVARTIEKTVSGLSKKGTYTYMAPEVYRGEPYGTNVDLYSLGIVMYKLLNNNREPFLPPHPQVIKYSDKNNALVRRMNGDVIPPPDNSNGHLNRIILRAVNFNPAYRYQTPAQMKADLISAKGASASGSSPVLRADHMAASTTHKTTQNQGQPSKTQAPSNTARTTGSSVPNRTARTMDPQMQSRTMGTYNPPMQNKTVGTYNPTIQSKTDGSYKPPVQNQPAATVQNDPVEKSIPKENTSNNASNNVFIFNANDHAQIIEKQNEKIAKSNKVLRVLATIAGWLGGLIWVGIMGPVSSDMEMYFFLAMSVFALLCMIPLSIKPQMKVFSIFMLIFSLLSLNFFFNLPASVLFLCIRKPKELPGQKK